MNAEILDWYTDAAKAIGKGFGGHHGPHWFAGLWNEAFLEECDPSIEYLELNAVAVGVLLWLPEHQNQRIVLFCDNISVVYMINSQTSRCRNCMVLIRLITLQAMVSNV